MIIGEVRALLDLIQRANAWRTEAIEGSRKKRARVAAQVLSDAGILVAAMRTFDNTYRRVLRRIRLLQPDASHEERKQVVEELTAFNERHIITPHINQASQSLTNAASTGKLFERGEPNALTDLLECADRFRFQIQNPIEEEKSKLSLHYELTRILLHSSSQEDLQISVDFAEAHLNSLSLKLLRDADRAFGRLRQTLVEKHDLPDPGWAIQVST